MERVFGRAATAILLVCSATLAVTLGLVVVRVVAPSAATTSSYVAGESIDLPASVYEGMASTAILFMSETCPACLESRGELRRLVEDMKAIPRSTVVLVTSSSAADPAVLSHDLGLDPSAVVAFDLRKLRLKHVPTVVLLDGRGTILFAREGVIYSGDPTVDEMLEQAKGRAG